MLTQAAMGVLALILGALTVAGIVRLWHVYRPVAAKNPALQGGDESPNVRTDRTRSVLEGGRIKA